MSSKRCFQDDMRSLDCQQKVQICGARIRLEMTTKNTRLTFRVQIELKKRLESVAASESRSVAQICEAFLHAGLAAYEKEGSKYISHYLAVRNSPTRGSLH
jgi:hypothetical protein